MNNKYSGFTLNFDDDDHCVNSKKQNIQTKKFVNLDLCFVYIMVNIQQNLVIFRGNKHNQLIIQAKSTSL